ncbi:MAG: exopolyphosphatase/guanosine-5'-triphosphate,3'-diphosphate pyrophosphatase [Cocleimonas sp.]|jgi:exopolyphosphatase/guanosine-5'-triphosphate,3'-diphosphate pyrophosphatase
MIAAVDLGSNSFHMIVVRVDEHGNFSMVDQMKEMVRLRGGLDEDNNMDEVVAQNALDCLQRFGDRIRHLDPSAVRAAGTNTLRTMNKSKFFLRKANKALGHRIEIIPGREEARLVYLGVSHTLSDDRGNQLVIDIGGGSTEFIIGEMFEPKILESLNFGSVSATKRFFADGKLSKKNWKKANTALRLEIMPIENQYSSKNWEFAIGSSGTIKATQEIIHAFELDKFRITLDALYKIRSRMIEMETIDQLELPLINTERLPVYAGGIAILIAVFEALKIEYMTVSEGALREGLLYDLLGRIQHEDVRNRSVRDLMKRFNIDTVQAGLVKNTALYCFKKLRKDWSLPKKHKHILGWAADLHELGMSITHDKHHLQGAHILEYADIPGFARRRQHWLSVLVVSHRKKLPTNLLDDLAEDEKTTLLYLIVILRLSVLLHRSRQNIEVLPTVKGGENQLYLSIEGDINEQALLEADLIQEKQWLSKVGFELNFE